MTAIEPQPKLDQPPCGCQWSCGGHGPMRYKNGWWYCYGWDGEGCIAGHPTRQADDHLVAS